MSKPLLSPVQTREGLSEWAARVAYRGYEISGHGSQSFERLHERGGFGLDELVHFAFIAGRGSRKGVEFGNELNAEPLCECIGTISFNGKCPKCERWKK